MQGQPTSACQRQRHRNKALHMYLLHEGLARIPAVGCATWLLASAPGLAVAQIPDVSADPLSRTPSMQSPADAGAAGRQVINWGQVSPVAGLNRASRFSTPLPTIRALSATAVVIR